MTHRRARQSQLPLQPGDLARYSRVFRVTSASKHYVEGVDEKNSVTVAFGKPEGTGKLSLVHRPHKKPPVGSRITGEKLANTMWKRGTVIENEDGLMVLDAMGHWHPLSYPEELFSFGDLQDYGGTATIRFLP